LASRDTLFRTESIGKGFRLHFRRTRAFKTVSARLTFQADLDEATAARAIVPRLLSRGTRRLPSLEALQIELDSLYGATLAGEARKIGERQVIQFRADWVHDRIAGAPMLESMGNLFAEQIHEPVEWTAAVFERERQILTDEARAVFDDKARYARQRLVEEMCRREAYARPGIGHEAEIRALEKSDAERAYKELVTRAPVDLFLVGDLTFRDAARFAKRLRLGDGSGARRKSRGARIDVGRVRTVKETQDIHQAKLQMGFRTPIRMGTRRYAGLVMANALFGGTPVGLLFKEVREKESLCYAISSAIVRSKGLVLVQAGIEPEQYGKTRRMILKQLNSLRAGDIREAPLEQARAMLLSGLRSMHDSPSALIEFALERALNGIEPDVERLRAELAAVTPGAIAAAARTIELDTVYLLTNGGA